MVKMTTNLKKIDESIGSKIYNLRVSSGYSRDDLAKYLQVSHQQVQKYEKGINRISPGRLMLIAEFLKVEFKDLYDDSETLTKSDLDTTEQRQSLELFKLFKKIKNQQFKQSICDVIRAFLKNNN